MRNFFEQDSNPSSVSCPAREYLPELEKARKHREKTLKEAKDDSMNRLLNDLTIDRAKNPQGLLSEQWDPELEEEDDDTEINIIDRSKWLLPGVNCGDAKHQGKVKNHIQVNTLM